MPLQRSHYARSVRIARRIHRTTGIFLFAVFLVIGGTGLLLGWKKHSGGYILPESRQGTSTDMTQWRSIDDLTNRAFTIAREHIDPEMALALERIDIRPGPAPFVYSRILWYDQYIHGPTPT